MSGCLCMHLTHVDVGEKVMHCHYRKLTGESDISVRHHLVCLGVHLLYGVGSSLEESIRHGRCKFCNAYACAVCGVSCSKAMEISDPNHCLTISTIH